jgi:hypothetical protein
MSEKGALRALMLVNERLESEQVELQAAMAGAAQGGAPCPAHGWRWRTAKRAFLEIQIIVFAQQYWLRFAKIADDLLKIVLLFGASFW